MQPRERADHLLAEARRHDPDRYLTALFAPGERREAVLALILFHHELARVPDMVRQPMMGHIRYQWWRDALAEIVAGERPRAHPVVMGLAEGIGRGRIAPAPLEAMIEAREQALERVVGDDLAAIEAYAAATAGRLHTAILAALGPAGADEVAAAERLGTALGLIGVIEAVAVEAARQPPPPERRAELRKLTDALVERAARLADEARRLACRPPRARMAAFLALPLLRRRLAGLRAAGDPVRTSRRGRAATAPLGLLWAHLRRRP